MKILKLKRVTVQVDHLEFKQGELMGEEFCGLLYLYMDDKDLEVFKESHNQVAVRLTIKEISS